MAGIGFRLRRLAENESLFGFLTGYLSAGMICCGPWIITVLALAYLGGHVLVTYCYCMSLITTGGLVMVVTRYLADRLYADDSLSHLPTLLGVLLVNSPIQCLLALCFVFWLPIPFELKAGFVGLFVCVSNTWLLMAFLGAVRAYRAVVEAYLIGGALAVFGAVGYFVGQGVVLLWMLRVLFAEFALTRGPSYEFLGYIRRFPALFLAGTLLNLCVWSGVFVYWTSPLAVWQYGLPTYYPTHDLALFLALLSILPALVIFFVKTETEFYEGYRAFFGGIVYVKVPLTELSRRKAEMIDALLRGLADVIKVQGIVTLMLVSFTSGPLRSCLMAAFFFALFQGASTILLYYEAYWSVALSAFLCVVLNVAVTYNWLAYHGLGLLVGSVAGFLVCALVLWRHLRSLERYTFMSQPMPGQQRGPVTEVVCIG